MAPDDEVGDRAARRGMNPGGTTIITTRARTLDDLRRRLAGDLHPNFLPDPFEDQ